MTDTCKRLRKQFVGLGVKAKTARGKRLRKLASAADSIEEKALDANCSWARRIDGWKIRGRR